MTELLLICAIGALGVAFATTVGRWLLTRPAGDPDLVRVANVVSGGVMRYLRRQHVVSLAVAAALGAAVFLVYGVAYQTEALVLLPGTLSARELGIWITLGYLLGCGFAIACSSVATWTGRHASARVAAGARRSLDEPLQIAIRAGAVAGVVALALGLVGLAGMFLAVFVYSGGWGGSAEALARAPRVPLLLPGFVLGAAFVALLGQLGGGIFGKVADLGADIAGELDASPPEDGAAHPAVLADLVGDGVGDGAARTMGVFAAAAAESLAAMLVASLVYRHNAELPSVTALLLYPLVARTFGLLAAWFGAMVVRTDDTEVPMNALARGLYVTTLLYAVGAVGSAKWLLGSSWLPLGGCAVLGAVFSVLLLYITQYVSEQRFGPVREVAEAARGGATLATLRGLLAAMKGAALVLVLVLGMSLGAYWLGSSTGLVGGGLLGLAIAVGGLLGAAPYVLAMNTLGSIVDTAGGIIEMTVAAERPDVRARARLLDSVGVTAKGYARALGTVASSLGSFLLSAVFLSEVWEGAGEGEGGAIAMDSPALYAGAVLGVVVVLAFAYVTLGRVVGAARDVVNELRARVLAPDRARTEHLPEGRPASGLGGVAALADDDDVDSIALPRRNAVPSGPPHAGPADPGAAAVSAAADRARGEPRTLGARLLSRQPSDREDKAGQLAFVETISRVALRGMLTPALVGVAIPILVGVALRLAATGDRVSTSAEALVALLFSATIAAAIGSLLFTNAGSAWDNAKKYIETGAHGGRYVLDPTASPGSLLGATPEHPEPGTPARSSAGSPIPSSSRREDEIDNPTYVAAAIGDTIGDPLKGVLGPATQALIKTLAALALVLLPFFL